MAIEIETIWGKYSIDNPMLLTVINSAVVQRLKHIDQSGPIPYFGLCPYYSRYDHSIGVMMLLIKAGSDMEEQIAGLLHDASHTAFSHVADHLFHGVNDQKSYQDDIHLDYLQQTEMVKILGNFNITIDQLSPDCLEYRALERPHPELCADRIEYIIHAGVIFGDISRQQSRNIVDSLCFSGGQWFFKSYQQAKSFAELSLKYTKNLWGSPWNFAFYEKFAKLLKYAIGMKIVTKEDLHFGHDIDILQRLLESGDKTIEQEMTRLYNIHSLFTVTSYGQGEMNTKPKFRGVDPLLLLPGEHQLRSLSEIDPDFAQKYNDLRSWCSNGYGIKYT